MKDIKTDNVWLMQGDCLERMKEIPDGSVDMVMCDPPYGTTACKWDSIIPLDKMWAELKRIVKPNGAIVMTASQPFTSKLICSNLNMFKYEIIWEKDNSSNFMLLKKQVGKRHENICVFYKQQPTYNPQMVEGKPSHGTGNNVGKVQGKREYLGVSNFKIQEVEKSNLKYPTSVVKFNGMGRGLAVHPTQKPVALMEYLIKTYSNEGETVLDFTMGSGTTGVACMNTGCKFIGIELDDNYFNIATKRILGEQQLNSKRVGCFKI